MNAELRIKNEELKNKKTLHSVFCILHSKYESGQALILSTIVLFLILLNTMIIISSSLNFFNSSKYTTEGVQAINLAEAGIDKAVASLNASGGNYNGESETVLGSGSYEVIITSKDASTNIVKSTGFIPNKANAKTRKTVQIQVSKGIGASFNYGVQVGDGGLVMQNNSRVNGSVYSNSNVIMNNGAVISGDAFVAGGTQPAPDEQSACSSNCDNFYFGKNISGNNQLDVAQSFRPTTTAVINKVSLRLKKCGNTNCTTTGSPPNLTVRLLGDDNNKPNKNNVLASGTLIASLVTNQYSFVEITFTTNPSLTADTLYWIVVDTNSDISNYWSWSYDTLSGYTGGSPAWSANWQASNPTWNNIAGDLDFRTYMGGVATSLTGSNTSIIDGNAHANTLQNITVTGHAYYQLESGITANGQNCSSNSYCHPGSNDPVVQNLPLSEGNITTWRETAEQAGQQNNISGCQSVIPAGKYGSISLNNNCSATFTSPIWVTGSLILDNGSQMALDSSAGAASGVVIVGNTDGTTGEIDLQNNGQIRGSGAAGSYTTVISLYDSTSNGVTAIDTDNSSASSILYAPLGIIYLHNNASLSEVTGWKLVLDNNATVNYSSGLANILFTSGPSGSFSAIKGTYQVK